MQKLGLPGRVKKGQTFETRIFVQADKAQTATVRLYRNEQSLGEQKVELNAGKNLFTFPQTLQRHRILQLQRAASKRRGTACRRTTGPSSFTNVRGDPRDA